MSVLTTETINRILELGEAEEKDINGIKHFSKQFHSVPEKLAEPFRVKSLSGIVDYITMVAPKDHVRDMHIQVKSPELVVLKSNLSEKFRKREFYLQAETTYTPFQFGHHRSSSDFVISLLSQFVQCENTALLMKFLKSVKKKAEVGVGDDGISQNVVATVSLGNDQKVNVPNPIILAPFRTFTEIDQPKSSFVFRLRGDGEDGTPIEAGLFESDGENWKLEAIKGIRDWLKEQDGMEDIPIIA